MKLNFRQGIIKSRLKSGKPDFLEYNPSNGTITIDLTTDDLLVSAAFKDANYLIHESTTRVNVWGPFDWDTSWGDEQLNSIYYLFWDINTATGKITNGFTPRVPISSGSEPTQPLLNQHWFDLVSSTMKVWNGSNWEIVVRVFAGSFAPGTQTIVHYPLGSQIGITNANPIYEAGYILLGNDMKGIKTDQNGMFLTTESDLIVNQGNYSSPVQLEALSTESIAVEPIPAFYAVTMVEPGKIGLSSGIDPLKRAIGIVERDLMPGDPAKIISSGYVFNEQWDWDMSLGKDLFSGESGELIQTDPVGPNEVTLRIGTIFNKNTILVLTDLYFSKYKAPTGIEGTAGPTGPAGRVGPTGPAGIGPTGPQADFSSLPYDLGFFFSGTLPESSTVIGSFVSLRPIIFTAGAPGSIAKAGVASTDTIVTTLTVNGTFLGTVTYNPGSIVGVINVPNQFTLMEGDVIDWISPMTPDATLKDIVLTLTGNSNIVSGNVLHVPGPTGPTGPTGVPGAPSSVPGPTGPTGAASSVPGPTGPSGIIGPTGPQGIVGPTGPIGPAGIDGTIGSIGPTGPQGADGINGPTGPTGPMGMDGAIGPTGPAGRDFDPTLWVPFDISFFYTGNLLFPDSAIGGFIAARQVKIFAGAAGSVTKSKIATTNDITFPLLKNEVAIGSISFLAGQMVGTVAIMSDVIVEPGDTITLMCPSTIDYTISDIFLTIASYSQSLPLL